MFLQFAHFSLPFVRFSLPFVTHVGSFVTYRLRPRSPGFYGLGHVHVCYTAFVHFSGSLSFCSSHFDSCVWRSPRLVAFTVWFGLVVSRLHRSFPATGAFRFVSFTFAYPAAFWDSHYRSDLLVRSFTHSHVHFFKFYWTLDSTVFVWILFTSLVFSFVHFASFRFLRLFFWLRFRSPLVRYFAVSPTPLTSVGFHFRFLSSSFYLCSL